MKIKVSTATGPALDWLVAKCESHTEAPVLGRGTVRVDRGIWVLTPRGGRAPHVLRNDFDAWVKKCEGYPFNHFTEIWQPTTDWAQGGPIIEREWLDVTPWPNESEENKRWDCVQHDCNPPYQQFGPTPLIAAMRAYVASKLGEEVDVPEELL